MRITTARNAIAAICITATLFLSFENEHPIGNTGSPIDGLCSDCHTPAGNFSGSIVFEFNDSGAFSDIYTEFDVGVPARFGYQFIALDDNNQQVGTFNNPSNSSLQVSGGVEYVGHQPSVFSPTGFTATEAPWDPQGFIGTVHFYIAWLAADDDGTENGDDVFFDEFVYAVGGGVLPLVVEIDQFADPQCNGDNNGLAIADVEGGVTPYEFLWSNGEDEATAVALGAGVHFVTVTDDAGSTAVAEIELDDPEELTITSEQGPTDCFGSDEGFIEVTASGGTGIISYDWGIFGDECCIYDLPASFYTVTVTDDNDCSFVETFEILEPSELVVIITTTPISLGGTMDGTASASVTGGTAPYEYEWSNGSTDSSISGLMAGNYTVAVTDANDCEVTQSVAISAGVVCDIELTLDILAPQCYPDSIGTLTIIATGGSAPYEYTWSDGSLGMSLTGIAGMSYGVTVSDASGCSLTQSAFLARPDSLSVSTQLLVPNSCPTGNSGVLLVDVSGGVGDYSLAWSNGLMNDTTIIGLDTLVNIPDSLFNLPDGFISYELVDGNGCTKTDTFLMTNSDNIAPVLILNTGTVFLNEMGVNSAPLPNLLGGSFDNCGIATFDILGQQDFTCADLGVRTVMLEVTDASGNISIGTTTLEIVDEIAPSITCPDNISVASCLAIDYDLPVSQDNCDGNVDIILTEGLASGEVFPAGMTTVVYTARDESGNESDCSFMIDVLSDLEAQASTTPADCGESNGSMSTIAVGGTPPYSYSVMNTNQMGLPAGDYEVIVTDSNGCSAIAQGTVASVGGLYENPPIFLESVCEGDTATFNVPIVEGDAPFSYSINGNSEEISTDGFVEITTSQSGQFNIDVTDANGCMGTIQVLIDVIPATFENFMLQLACTQTAIPIADVPLLLLGTTIEGNPTELTEGEYDIIRTAQTADGCGVVGEIVGIITVLPAEDLDVDVSVVNSSCSVSDGVLTLNTTGGIAPYTYVPFGPVQGGLGAGNYSITVSDAAGCTAETIVEIMQENAPSLIVTESFICHNATDGTIGLEAQGGTPPYEYFLGFISQNTPIDGPFTIQDLIAGGYNVRAVDAAGCEARATAVVRSHPELIAELIYTGAECDFDPLLLVPEISGGILPYTPLIEQSVTDPNLWLLTVSDAADCIAISNYAAMSDAPLTATFDIAYDCDGTFVTDLLVAGGCPPYMFSYDLSDLPGDHQLVVTDASGDAFVLDYQILEILPLSATIIDVEPVSDVPGSVTSQVEGGLAPYSYVWLNAQGDTLSTEADLLDIVFTMPQDVTFVVIDDLGCTDSVTVTVDVISDVNELEVVETFEVFPNPVEDILTLKDTYSQEALISIYDYRGQKIEERIKLNNVSVVNVLTTDWASGLYYIRIVTELGIEVFQLVKI